MTKDRAGRETVVHATAVAFGDRAALILGPAGSGKSALALALMALGAGLLADDRTRLELRGGRVFAGAPAGLPALIEARGVGLLRARLCPPAPLVLAVDLTVSATARLPPRRSITLLGCAVDLVHAVATPHFPAAIRQYILHGREA
ncbi:MAG: HPr kinase/phosphorylase [Gemmobacter sp.]